MKKIFEKIDSLGKRIDRIKKNNPLNTIKQFSFPELYLEVSKKYKSFSFENSIVVKAIQPIPISEDGYVSVESFYDTIDSVQLYNDYLDQLPFELVPISEGEPGDLICIDTNKERFGEVYYWDHEGLKGEDVFLIANSFEEFVMNLEIFDEDKDEEKENYEPKIVNVKVSDNFLKLLKRDGYGTKQDI